MQQANTTGRTAVCTVCYLARERARKLIAKMLQPQDRRAPLCAVCARPTLANLSDADNLPREIDPSGQASVRLAYQLFYLASAADDFTIAAQALLAAFCELARQSGREPEALLQNYIAVVLSADRCAERIAELAPHCHLDQGHQGPCHYKCSVPGCPGYPWPPSEKPHPCSS